MSLGVICTAVRRGPLMRVSTLPTLHKKINILSIPRTCIVQRLLSSNQNSTLDSTSKIARGPKDNFITIYKFPPVRLISNFNRIKSVIVNGAPAIIALPVCLNIVGFMSASTTIAACTLAALFATNLYLTGLVLDNTVGFVYTSPDGQTIQIAYVDTNGLRQDVEIPASDIIPFSEVPATYTDNWYLRLHRFSEPKSELCKLYVTRQAEILDMERFQNVFGKVEW